MHWPPGARVATADPPRERKPRRIVHEPQKTLKLLGAAAAAFAGTPACSAVPRSPRPSRFTLPPLGYPYEALEPHIDTATMNFHHKNHHNAFISNLNGLVEKYPDLATKPPEEILSNLSAVPEAVRTPVRNNLGGHWNHTFFWELMTPGGAKAPAGDLKSAIDGTFGDFDKMKAAVKQAAVGRFGSGWAWLAVKDKKLTIFNTPYQDTPHMDNAAHGGGRHRRVGARLLPQAPVQARRLRRRVVERGELGQGGRQLQEGHGVSIGAPARRNQRAGERLGIAGDAGWSGMTWRTTKRSPGGDRQGFFLLPDGGYEGQPGKLV